MKSWTFFVIAVVPLMAWNFAAMAQADRPWFIDGKPIPLACFTTLNTYDSTRQMPVDLGKCRTGVPPGTVAVGPTSFNDTDDSGYFHYSYLGEKDGLAVLFVESSGGGTGQFSEIWGLKHTGDVVQLAQSYAAGDRCNTGVSDARLVGEHLVYNMSITPSDLIAMGDRESSLAPYKDLEAAALSCVAVVHMRDDKIEGVTLTDKDRQDTSGWTEQYRYQSCFNGFYRDALRKGADMTAEQLSMFARDFVQACVKK